MHHYTVTRIGNGTWENPYRPDIPTGTNFVGTDNVDGTFLIAVNNELPVKAGRTKQLPRQALEVAAKARGLKYDDVAKWFVSE